MAIGLVGRKCGMTRVFTDAGESIPVTVIEVLPNRVTQVKTTDKDGYRAVQVTYGSRRPQLISKAAAGHFAKAGTAPGKALVEFRLAEKEGEDLAVGAEIKADHFTVGQIVDVTGTTIGKGFRGNDEASQLRRSPRDPRCVGLAPYPGFHRSASDAGPCVSWQAHVRSHGCGASHHRESQGRRSRRRT